MAVTKTTYTQSGSTTQYNVPFEVIAAADIDVYINGVLQLEQNTASTAAADHPQVVSGEITQGTALTNYTVAANNATITFNAAPAASAFIILERTTDATGLSTFVNGSTIRAKDLNDSFERIQFIAEEGVSIADEGLRRSETEDNAFDAKDKRISDVADATDDDDAVNRAQLGKVITDDLIAGEGIDLTDATGGTNSNKQVTVSAEFSTDSNPGIITVDATTPITRTYGANGQLDLSIADGAIDFAKIDPNDVVTESEQNSGTTPTDNNIFTALAARTRFDTLVQTGTPTGSDWETGKTWYQNDNDQTVYIWNGSTWEAVTSGGTFTKLDQVIYVDANNGDDANDGHRISNPKKTIKAALAAVNSDSTYGDGSTILVAPGVYKETAPLDIQKRDVAIIGASVRNVIVHPTSQTETNSLFRVNSGSYLAHMTFTGVKASGTRGASGSLWEDSTYGLPPTQGWNVSFYPNAMIYKSPYIQNCTNFSDSEIDNDDLGFYDGDEDKGRAGDADHAPTGGGLLVNGDTVHDDSPLRSMVADSYTHVGLDGPGIFVTNNGYTQITSSYAFFNHFHIACLNGGQANLAASTSDFGRFSLVASGKSTTDIFDGLVKGSPSTLDTTFVVDGLSANTGWHGSAVRPAGNMLVEVGGNLYPILSATRVSDTEFTVEISRPDPNDRTSNLGLSNSPADNSAVKFYLRSQIASSGHTMEYVGAGLDYRALPENASGTYTYGATTKENGVPIEAHQKVELDNGKIWAAITDHNGKFRVGETFSVDQTSGFVSIPAGALSVSTLLEDLDVNGKEIKTDTTNQDIVLNPNGTGVVNVSTSKITNVVDPTDAQDAATKNFVDNLTTSTTAELNILDGATLNTSELNTLDGITASTSELNQLDGLTVTGTLTPGNTSDLPTSSAVSTYVSGLLNALGGFVAIADENSFPTTNPDPSDNAGTVVSIANAGGMAISASGVGTGQTTAGTTVTINGFPSSFNSTTLPAQQGLQVVTTSTLNTYNYHKVIARDDDIVRLNDDVNDFFQRYRVNANEPTTDLDGGDLWFDTTAGKMKVYDANDSAWEEVQSVGDFLLNTLSSSSGTGGGSATFNGTAYRFTLNNAGSTAFQMLVSVNGVVQKPNSGTTQPSEGFALDGNDIIFSDAPATSSPFFIVTIGSSINIGTPSNNTVTADKIVDGSITNAEISSSAAIASSKLAKPIDLADNEKVRFGTGNDLAIYHNGTNNYIDANGDLYVRVNNGTETAIYATANGKTSLNYDNNEKLQTTSTGIDVNGEVQGDSLNIDGAADIIGPVSINADTTYSLTSGTRFSTHLSSSDAVFSIVDNTADCVTFESANDSGTEYGQFRFTRRRDSDDDIAEVMRLDGEGRLLVNTVSGTESVHVNGAIASVGTSSSFSGGAKRAFFDYNGGTNLARIGATSGANNAAQGISFHTSPSGSAPGSVERIRITSDGTLQLRNSPGIDFSQIQTNASGVDSEILDSYEEGTWTPTLLGTSTDPTVNYTNRVGTYTRIGNKVTVWVMLQLTSASGGSGNINIGGLPFNVTNDALTSESGTFAVNWYNFTGLSTGEIPSGFSRRNDDKIYMNKLGTGTGSGNIAVTTLGAGWALYANCTYYVD